MKCSSLARSYLVVALMAVMFSWTPHESASAVTIAQAYMAMNVKVDQRCAISSLPILFGTYNISNPSPTDAEGRIQVTCDSAGANNANRLRISQGQSPAAGSTAANPRRQMAGGYLGDGHVRYDLYQDAARTEIWGDTTGTAFFPGSVTYPVEFPVYGRIPALQPSTIAKPGVYADTVVVGIYF